MKILYQMLSLDTIYAGRTIYHGYKNACEDLSHEFLPYTANDNLEVLLKEFKPDIFITALNKYSLKFLDLNLLNRYRKNGLKVFVNIPFWTSPLSKSRINESVSLGDNKEYVSLIRENKLGDCYYNICEQGDARMEGFEKITGFPYHTILLAADKTILKFDFDEKFKSDIAYIGTYLPAKRQFFQEYVFPLEKKYNLRLYGQDWTQKDRMLGWIQRIGQYFNIPYLRSIQKPKLQLEDEARVYSSATVCINVHETYQKEFGGDCNERTFKIPLCGGFEITDDVACIHRYFRDDEMVIAKDKIDWFQKIEYYIRNPEKRLPIIEAGRKRVLADHTYHNRVQQIIDIYKKLKKL